MIIPPFASQYVEISGCIVFKIKSSPLRANRFFRSCFVAEHLAVAYYSFMPGAGTCEKLCR
jgi:hypothetical protein